MKTYGVNWFLAWIGLVILFCPIYLWAENVLLLPCPHMTHSQPPILVQAFGQSFGWLFLFYYVHGKTLSDPEAIERLRQNLQRSKGRRGLRYRWPIMWTLMLAIFSTASTISRLIFGSPSWLYVAGYCLLVLCSCLAAMWLIDAAAKKGQLAQLLEGGEKSATG